MSGLYDVHVQYNSVLYCRYIVLQYVTVRCLVYIFRQRRRNESFGMRHSTLNPSSFIDSYWIFFSTIVLHPPRLSRSRIRLQMSEVGWSWSWSSKTPLYPT